MKIAAAILSALIFIIPTITSQVIKKSIANFTYQQTAEEVDFFASGERNVVEWYWDFEDRAVPSTKQNPTHTYFQEGGFIVTLISTNGNSQKDTIKCNIEINSGSKTDSCIEYDTTHVSINNLNNNSQTIAMYPNPTRANAKIIGLDPSQTYSFVLRDLLGRKVKDREVINNSETFIFNVELIKAGQYLLEISTNSTKEFVKLEVIN
jgi:hypothetical protein